MRVLDHLKRSGAALPWFLTALLSAALLMASGRIRSEKESVAEERLKRRTLQAGDFVPDVSLRSTADSTLRIGAPGADSAQVLILLTSTCQFCRASVAAWNELADSLRAVGYRATMIAVTTDSVDVARTHRAEVGLSAPLGVISTPRHAAFLRARAVPQIAIVAADGRVRYARLGVLEVGAALDSLLHAVRLVTATTQPARPQ